MEPHCGRSLCQRIESAAWHKSDEMERKKLSHRVGPCDRPTRNGTVALSRVGPRGNQCASEFRTHATARVLCKNRRTEFLRNVDSKPFFERWSIPRLRAVPATVANESRRVGLPRADRLPAQTGWVLLPLRLFLGGTFAFAGLQKLADTNYLDVRAPSGVHQQLLAGARTSPIGGVLTFFAHHSTVVGLLIAFSEIAIGVGALLGLWTRFAGLGGVVVSIGFLLSVSWHTHPYYLGSDTVFAVAWTPLLIAGAAGVFSLDALLARRAQHQLRLPRFGRVDIEFAAVRDFCGSYSKGKCERLNGAGCDPGPCPVLAQTPLLRPELAEKLNRRQFLDTAKVAAGVAASATIVGGGIAGLGRLLHQPPPQRAVHSLGPPTEAPTTTTTSGPAQNASPPPITPRPAGSAVGSALSVPVGGAASFTDPFSGSPAYVVQPTAGIFRCFSAVCTHAGCTVDYSKSGQRFVCPCHGAEFDATSGAVLGGPTNQPLPAIDIALGGDGQLYVTN